MQLEASTFIVRGVGTEVADATARRFHAAGARLMLVGTDEVAGARLVRELGPRVDFRRVRLSQGDDFRDVVHQTKERFGRIDGLVNCACSMTSSSSDDADAALSRIVDADVLGSLNLIRAVVDVMTEGRGSGEERGVVVNVSFSRAWAERDQALQAAAHTAGVCSMSLLIARALSTVGVRVVTVASGPTLRPVVFTHPPDVQGPAPLESQWDDPDGIAAVVEAAVQGRRSGANGSELDALSRRQLDVLRLVTQGKRDKEIGRALGISARTVQIHVSKILAATGVATRAGASAWFTERERHDRETRGRSLESLLTDLSQSWPRPVLRSTSTHASRDSSVADS